MPVMLERWNDDKMDALDAKVNDLGARMEKGFERVDGELRELRQEMKAGFERIDDRFKRFDDRFERLDERFERIDDRFERMHRLMTQLCGMTIVALIGLIATQL